MAGAAIATTLANLTSALLILRQLTRTQDAYRLIPREIRIHKATLLHILGIGVPAAIESAMAAASSLLIQVPINPPGHRGRGRLVGHQQGGRGLLCPDGLLRRGHHGLCGAELRRRQVPADEAGGFGWL